MPHRTGLYLNAASTGQAAELYLYGHVDRWGEINLKRVLEALAQLSPDTTLHVRINSNGGDVFEGTAILNALQRHKGTVHTYVDGIAASMASVLFQAGATRTMAENAMLMVHNPWTYAEGDAATMRKAAEVLDKVRTNLLTTYSKRSGKPVDELGALLDAETWLTAQEAVAMQLADSVSESVLAVQPDALAAAANALGLRIAAYSPKPAAEPKPETQIHTEMNMSLLAANLGLPETAGEAEVLAAAANLKAERDRLAAAHKAAEDAAARARVDSLIAAAIADKKILPAAKAQWAQLAEKDYASTEAILDGMPKAGSLGGHVQPVAEKGDEGEDRSDWSFRDWAKRDPKGLMQLKQDNPTRYYALLKANTKH
jgi:ATP-dependent Clp endopeptidase proteolytic subunit ClpP